MSGQPAGTRPVRINQRRPGRSPDNELNLAERGSAGRRQPVMRVRSRRGPVHEGYTHRKKCRGDDDTGASNGILEAFAEQGDRAGVAGLTGLVVQGIVQVRTGGKQAQQPDG